MIVARPTLTLEVNGDHPSPPVVTTTGTMLLSLDVSPNNYTAAVDWYWALVVNAQLFWVTPTGLSTTAAPLAHVPPTSIANAALINVTLPPATTVTSSMYLVNGGGVVASDSITAQR